jgi:hypothetical protein
MLGLGVAAAVTIVAADFLGVQLAPMTMTLLGTTFGATFGAEAGSSWERRNGYGRPPSGPAKAAPKVKA